jgi:ABC-2 type transport system permease protein
MARAGRGAACIQEILAQEIADAIYHGQKPPAPPLTLVVRAKFNPNLTFSWFIGVMHIVNDITLLAMFPARRGSHRER